MNRSNAMLALARTVYLGLVAGLLLVVLSEPATGARAAGNLVVLILFFAAVMAPAAYLFRPDPDIHADD